MNISSEYNDLIDNNQCVINARRKNLTDIYMEIGTPELLYDSGHILLTRIIPATITCPFGIILNCLFLYVVFKVSAMRTLTNMYLSNQAIVDCMFLSVYYIVQVGEPLSSDVVHDKSFLGPVGCFIVNISLDLCLFVSEFNIVLVTFERYMAICKPFKADRISSKSRTFKLIVLTWIMGFVFSAPISSFYTKWYTTCIIWPPSNETVTLPMTYSNCFSGVWTPLDGILHSLTPIIAFVLVIAIIIVLNVLTTKELQRGVRKFSVSAHDLKQRLHQQRQIVVMLAVTAGVLFVCLLPYHLDLIIGYLYNTTHPKSVIIMPQAWNELVRWLPMVNSSVNPIVYGILNKQYRRAFITTLGCCDNCHDTDNRHDYMMTSVTTCNTTKKSRTTETTYNLKSNLRGQSPIMHANSAENDDGRITTKM
ncbi:growth hormone secretagogue receptor type 1-like [Saccoglossus kowalevskii]|uniref:Neuromedin-U receptor 2-like n=1 Tax=Saccoglossus kowalevskii TaxID=10224 RepID=A0ABM0MVZ5_SACKO|nr:PREDICTED: neuromedin-U receptor 2-like [Saccoglossus kowalevskii]